MRDIQSGVGRWGMATPLTLNFGLGSSPAIDSVVVRWAMKGLPTTTITNPPINKLLRIHRDGVTTDVKDLSSIRNDLELFPQPASQELTIRIPDALRGHCSIDIFSAFGSRIMSQQQRGEEYVRVPVASLANGLYIVRVGEGSAAVSKSFIKSE